MKKNYLKLVVLALGLLSFACKKESLNTSKNAQSESEKTSAATLASYTITTGMTVPQMNAVIASASAGDTVFVQPGTYTITAKIVMKAGVTLKRLTSSKPVFDAQGMGSELFEMAYGTEINNCSFIGIAFYNIRIRVTDASNVKFWYCFFDYGKRKPGTDKTYLSDAYLQFTNTDASTVDSCSFNRRSGNSGRGIYSLNTTNLKIINNRIGNNGSLGYFVTAINGSTNTASNTQIQANTIRRHPTWVNDAETDHGIYMHSFDGVLIKYNTISGWPPSASGGSIKIRNAQNAEIFGNHLTTSGILLYCYESTAHPWLKNVLVSNNDINIATNANDIYHGIGYWRNNTTTSEYSIRIVSNTLPNGTINITGTNLNVANFNANNGGVFSNDYGILNLKAGIANSGNY